jgi:hypothetical protein
MFIIRAKSSSRGGNETEEENVNKTILNEKKKNISRVEEEELRLSFIVSKSLACS